MRPARVALLSLVGWLGLGAGVGPALADHWQLPKDRDVYLLEDDLVYARFLLLARGGTYRQINRDEHGSSEVDRGRWEQGMDRAIKIHSSCRALRPRGLRSGPLSIVITGREDLAGATRLLASARRFLGEYADDVFAPISVDELNVPGAPNVRLEPGDVAFTRADLAGLVERIAQTRESERDGTYVLEPVGNASVPLFILRGSVFGASDLAQVRAEYRIGDHAAPPFYFGRIDADDFARQVGRWQPLHIPGGNE